MSLHSWPGLLHPKLGLNRFLQRFIEDMLHSPRHIRNRAEEGGRYLVRARQVVVDDTATRR